MMLLLRGPAGSGKTARILEQLRIALRETGRGPLTFRLLTPTSTMAQHLRNEMAREGHLVRPGSILTLSSFVSPWAQESAPVSAALLSVLVDRSLAQQTPAEFAQVASFPGFREALARLIQEVSAAGGDSSRLARTSPGLASIFREIETELSRRKSAFHAQHLRIAAERIAAQGPGEISRVWLDGFFSFTDPELALIDSIRRHAEVTVTLPAWQGNDPARRRLREMGFAEQNLDRVRAQPKISLMVAPTLDQEAGEIARRIVEQHAAGRPFREIGILVRTRDPYVPALENALHRFGIPARFYFGEPLAAHAVCRYLIGVVEAMLCGWEHEQTLAALRMVEPGPALDGFEFRVRARLPGRGLDSLRDLTTDFSIGNLIESCAGLDAWHSGTATAKQWAERAASLRSLAAIPTITDGVTHEKAARWRSAAAALTAFFDAIEETAAALGEDEIGFSDFWRAAVAVFEKTTLRVPDYRRDVVHVIDAYEARQWELPCLFVCGLLEKQFPQYHTQDPILSDAQRLRLRPGLRLRTVDEWEIEERFLFDLATTRATDQLVLSYPGFNTAGDQNLPSFYLDRFLAGQACAVLTEIPIPVRPQPARTLAAQRVASIYDEQLRHVISEKFRSIRPTAIELFLQCPFRFFAEQTLGLQPPPPAPEKRLDPLVQGTIVHEVLKEWQRRQQPLEPLFTKIFEEQCRLKRVPPGYRTETYRREMYRNIGRALPQIGLELGWQVFTEEKFRFELEPGLEIPGRIDRYDVSPDRRALVIDYKYSSDASLRQRVREDDDSERYVQSGLYLIALQESLGYEPAGMLYCGLKKETTWHGWHLVIEGLKVGTACTPQVLFEQLEKARERSLSAVYQIREGQIVPAGTDVKSCKFCDSYDICRFESAGRALTGGHSEA